MSKTVVLVAPVAPFRGGIARHSQALARALSQRADVDLRIVSFSRLFPKALYPGASDRDPDGALPHGLAAGYTLDTLNPLSWRSAANDIVRMRPAIVVMPAWTFFVAPLFGWLARALRRNGIPVSMIVHNASDHEQSGWKSGLLNWQLASADAFVTHTDHLARRLHELGHSQPTIVTPHPAYSDFPQAAGTLPREHPLELLCFGLVRRYKGIDIALRAFAAAGLAHARLTVAGEIWEDARDVRMLAETLPLRGRVQLIDRYVSDAEAAELFARCDAVLAPYRSVTGSGVAALARHYRRPLIAPDLPGFGETIQPRQTGWLYPSGDEAALTELLRHEITRDAAAAMHHHLDRAAAEDGWAEYCQSVLDLLDRTTPAGGNEA